jgi:hypothetical protein
MTYKAIVLCGDFIDGFRVAPVKDSNGHNEVLLHMLIYNLRLQAAEANSYIFCVLGNHDFMTFHQSNQITEFNTYARYIHNTAYRFYSAYSQKTFGVPDSLDAVYMARSYLLSRFYLIGFGLFLKINDTMFAHAGFDIQKNVFSYFENGQTNTNTIQNPQYRNRLLLEGYTSKTNYVSNKFHLIYQHIYNTNPVLKSKQHRIPTHLLTESLFTRKLQRDCPRVQKILHTYGVNLLVVGHCTTCVLSVFRPENVTGIHADCSDARIVYSCNHRLVSVDIALSSAFTPQRNFLECLEIYHHRGQKKMRRVRYDIRANTKETNPMYLGNMLLK